MSIFIRLGKFWFIILLVCLGVYIGINNRENTSIHLPPVITSITVPSFIALTAAFLIGATCMSLFFAADSFAKSWRIRKLQKKIVKLEQVQNDQ